jgi:TPR repeat protein
MRWYRKAAEQWNSAAANGLAWSLAVNHDATLRDGKEAVSWANKACEATEFKDSSRIDTLAAAYAEAGDFAQAIKYQQMALERTEAKSEARTRMQDRLKLYQQGLPFYE